MSGLFNKIKEAIPNGPTGLGIDVGTGGIKVVELASSGSPRLANYGELVGAPALRAMHDPAAQGSGSDKVEEEVGSLISDVLHAMNVKHKHAAMALPAHAATVSVLEFPAMKEKNLHNAVLYQAERIITQPLAEVVLDWEIVEELPETEASPAKVQVLVAAVPRNIVDRYVRIAKHADITLSGLEAEPFSLVRVANTLVPENSLYAVLDFGGYRSSLVFGQGSSVRGSVELQLTGSKLTAALANAIGIDEERAESMKIEHGLITSGATNFRATLGPFVDGLVGEIRSNFTEHAQRTGGGSVEHLFVSGGAARLLGFSEYLTEHFGISVSALDSFSALALPDKLVGRLDSVAPAYGIAVGLALRHQHEHRNQN